MLSMFEESHAILLQMDHENLSRQGCEKSYPFVNSFVDVGGYRARRESNNNLLLFDPWI